MQGATSSTVLKGVFKEDTTTNTNNNNILQFYEAEEIIQQLIKVPLEETLSEKWTEQHTLWGKLNVQAHLNIQSRRDEFISSLLSRYEQIPLLVQQLQIAYFWRTRVAPSLLSELNDTNHLQFYMSVYHEATLANLLEVVLSDRDHVMSMDENSLLVIVDYCAQGIQWLNTQYEYNDEFLSEFSEIKATLQSENKLTTADELLQVSAKEQMEQQLACLTEHLALSTLSILHLLTDPIDKLPMAVPVRLLSHHDLIASLVHVLERAPWQSQQPFGYFQYGVQGTQSWSKCSAQVYHKRLPRLAAQVWLTFYTLLADPECKSRYEYDESRKNHVLRVRPLLDEKVVDQVAVLQHLQRFLDELMIMAVPLQRPSTTSRIVELEEEGDALEQVWQHNANTILTQARKKLNLLGKQHTSAMHLAKQFASVYDSEALHELTNLNPICAQCGAEAAQRCSQCKETWYCGRACQVKAWPRHKPSCTLIQKMQQGKLHEDSVMEATHLLKIS